MEAVMEHERSEGRQPRDVSEQRLGYDIESFDPVTGEVRFIEVKGRASGATTVTVTRNEIFASLNNPDQYWLAVVEVDNAAVKRISYIPAPFRQKPDFTVTSVNYHLQKLLDRGEDRTWQLERN